MKTKIIEALSTRFAGLNQEVLNRLADKLVKTVATEDAIQGAVDAATFQSVLDVEADRRATEATQSAVRNYEKKHSLKDGKIVTPASSDPTPPESATNDDTPAWAKALLEANKSLQERIAGLESGKVQSSRKTVFDTTIAAAGDKLKTALSKQYERLTFKDDEDFNAWIEELKKDVEQDAQEQKETGATFGFPKTGNKGNDTEEKVPEQLEKLFAGNKEENAQPF